MLTTSPHLLSMVRVCGCISGVIINSIPSHFQKRLDLKHITYMIYASTSLERQENFIYKTLINPKVKQMAELLFTDQRSTRIQATVELLKSKDYSMHGAILNIRCRLKALSVCINFMAEMPQSPAQWLFSFPACSAR